MEVGNSDRFMPLHGGSELSVDSFGISQYDNIYMLAGTRYYQFYASYIRPRMLQYAGWVQGFHNLEYGILPSLFLQKVCAGIISTIFGRPIVYNATNKKTTLRLESSFKKAHFGVVVKEAYSHCVAGGTSLIKINKDNSGNLQYEAVPMNRFFVTVDSYGGIERTKCFLTSYHDTISASVEYHLCEERFWKYAHGKKYPMLKYKVYMTSSNITNEFAPNVLGQGLKWGEIPKDIQHMLRDDYGEMWISEDDSDNGVILLPFADDLGVRLLKFTANIPSFPKLPFGQPICDLLMNESYQYDQLKYFERIEVYTARARVVINEQATNPNDPESRKTVLDPLIYTRVDNIQGTNTDTDPTLIQPLLRANDIRTQKQNILNDTAFALGLSSSTVAAWLSDGTSQKTATEIEYERTKTESFINSKIELIQEPLQELIDIYFNYYGVSSPQLKISPESQTSRTESIRLFAELYEKGLVTSAMLAEKINGTASDKQNSELANYIERQKLQQQEQANLMTALQTQQGGNNEPR